MKKLTLKQKREIAWKIWLFDAYGNPDIMEEEEYSEIINDPEDLIADLTEWYINGELTEPDDPEWLDLIRFIREMERR